MEQVFNNNFCIYIFPLRYLCLWLLSIQFATISVYVIILRNNHALAKKKEKKNSTMASVFNRDLVQFTVEIKKMRRFGTDTNDIYMLFIAKISKELKSLRSRVYSNNNTHQIATKKEII